MFFKKPTFWIVVSIIFFVLLADILIKSWCVQQPFYPQISYPYGGRGIFKNVFGTSFSIVLQTNKGAILGVLSSWQYLLVILRIGLAFVLTFFLFYKRRPLVEVTALSFIIAGALGNILDFFIYGHVIDMFKLVFGSFHYPTFNIADSAICVGAFLYFLTYRRRRATA